MAALELQQGEKILVIAKGFPQTAGYFYLTNKRLLLEPDQFDSLGFGKRWEVLLSRVVNVEKLERFKGGTWIGGAGKKLVIRLDDSSLHTFSFYPSSNIEAFYQVFIQELEQVKSSDCI